MNNIWRRLSLAGISLILLFAIACSAKKPVLSDGTLNLGSRSFKITTTSPEAQRAFDRGLTLAYAFAHTAAEKEFKRAVELDPECGMCWWGIAYVNGPHVNYPLVPEPNAKRAWDAVSRAKRVKAQLSQLEGGFIAVQAVRYSEVYSENRRSLDENYAAALRALWKLYPNNSDVAAMFTESLMDLRPWDYWDANGAPQPGMNEAIAALDQALKLDKNNPLANHLEIHLWEASKTPERALDSAERLRTMVPGSGHLVHMPAHIWARVGRWDSAVESNVDAIKADSYYRKLYVDPGFYAMYMAHNQHFLAFTYMMQGKSASALKTARDVVADIPNSFLRDYAGIADGFMVFVHETLMRFGRWEQLLAEPAPRGNLPLSNALWRFTRASAYIALNRFDDARLEREAFKTAAAKVPADAFFGTNMASDLLKIANHVLEGELAARQGYFNTAIVHLERAIVVEDALKYDEPPDWIIPVRHALGSVLLRANRGAAAEKVYKEDLVRFPENGWSLYGLSKAYTLQGKKKEAAETKKRFEKAWKGADVKIDSSCLCQAK